MDFEVSLRNNEDSENLVKRFIRKSRSNKVFQEVSERRYYKKPSKKKREKFFKRRAAIKREKLNKQSE